jgi:uncharacterized coiled-coil DUF342 family protein
MDYTDELDLLQAQVDREVERLVDGIEAELRELRAARDELNDRIRELMRRRLLYARRSTAGEHHLDIDVDLAA